MNSLKRHYTGLKLTSEGFACESPVLVGSKTAMKINIEKVEVEDFKNGFESETGGFKEISFD